MSLLDTPEIKDQAFQVSVRSTGASSLRVVFNGTVTLRDPGSVLTPFFDKLHKVAVTNGRKKVLVDLQGLRFMNSAGFKHFVAWVKANAALSAEQRYAIHFVLNPAHRWQSVSIHALRCFSMDEITAEDVVGAKP